MSRYILTSIIVLPLLVVLAYVCGLIFKIEKDSFYRIFHFLGGGFTFLLIYGFLGVFNLSLFLTFIVGILWEIHEVLMWKYVFKKKKKKPGKVDTIEDLFMDMFGAVSFYFLLR